MKKGFISTPFTTKTIQQMSDTASLVATFVLTIVGLLIFFKATYK